MELFIWRIKKWNQLSLFVEQNKIDYFQPDIFLMKV